MLELRDISKKYGDKLALQNVSMSLCDGVYGLLGPNGAGKSTLMNIITENINPTTGEVYWDEEPIKKLGVKYRSILGYAPQQQGLYDTFTGRRFLSYMGTLKNIHKKDMAGEIERVASYVNLTQVLDRMIGTYSGGMKQRLLIAQSIMGDPKLIVMDEPTAGLDPKERVRIREKIQELAEGRIILVATHVVSDIESIAKEIIILKEGSVVAKDKVDSLCQRFSGNMHVSTVHQQKKIEKDNQAELQREKAAQNLESVYMQIFGEEVDYE